MEQEKRAFHDAVIKFISPEWSPACPDRDTFGVKGEHLTISQVCERVKDITDELPDWVVGKLMEAMHSDQKMLELLGRTRTYAVGSQCLQKLLEARVADFKAKR